MKHHPLAHAVALGLATWAASAGAQSVPPAAPISPFPQVNTPVASGTGFEASGIPSSGIYLPRPMRLMDGGLLVTPTIGVAVGHNDNVNLSPSNEIGSPFLSVAPKIVATSAYRANRYSFGYQAEALRYSKSSKDNIDNQELAATGLHGLDTRTTINWRASYQDRYDAVGSTDRTTFSGTPDHWRGATAVVAGRYGAEGAKGRLEGEIGYFDKKYANNRVYTADADYKSTNVVGRFGWRVAPKTTALIEYRHTQFDYRRDVQNLDNTENRLLLGAEWVATAATTGTFKAGYLNKKYDAVRPTFKGLTWEGGVRWSPLTYSHVDFSTGRGAEDPAGSGGNYVVSSFATANWVHNWTTYLSSKVGYLYRTSRFDGLNRRDKTHAVTLGMNYDVRQWVRLGVDYQFSRRDSTLATFDYDRNLITIMGEFSF